MRTFTMKVSAAAAVALLMVGGLVTKPARAASTSPGKNSAFESSDFGNGDMPQAVTTLLTATLLKGKKKHVLVVEATLSSGTSPVPSYLFLRATVNGFPMEPLDSGLLDDVLQACNNGPCILSPTWWLDLDAAELAHPGMFIKQPLTVTLLGGEGFPAPQLDSKATMSVRLQKK
jgi:hypothetical protein